MYWGCDFRHAPRRDFKFGTLEWPQSWIKASLSLLMPIVVRGLRREGAADVGRNVWHSLATIVSSEMFFTKLGRAIEHSIEFSKGFNESWFGTSLRHPGIVLGKMIQPQVLLASWPLIHQGARTSQQEVVSPDLWSCWHILRKGLGFSEHGKFLGS